MQVSHNTIGDYASIFTSFRDNLQSLKGGKYTSSNISNLTETAGGIQFASWDDEVSTKLKSNRDELSGTILPKVSSSISNEFNTMCTLATNLCNEYSNYKSYNQTYYSIKSDETDEEKKETRRKAGINRESSLTKINGYLTELAKINFGGSSGSTGGTNGRGLNPNYVPEKPDYDAWNEGMYGDGYWNSDGTHNEKSGGTTFQTSKWKKCFGADYGNGVTVNGNRITVKAPLRNVPEGWPKYETITFTATELDTGLLFLRGDNGFSYICDPNSGICFDVTGAKGNNPSDIMVAFSELGGHKPYEYCWGGGDDSIVDLVGYSCAMRSAQVDGYGKGLNLGCGETSYY